MILRPATEADSALLLRWRNDPETIRSSISERAVAPAEHARWVAQALADRTCRLYVAVAGQTAVGTGRLDLLGQETVAEVSVTVAPARRGRGYAEPLILALVGEADRLGCQLLERHASVGQPTS